MPVPSPSLEPAVPVPQSVQYALTALRTTSDTEARQRAIETIVRATGSPSDSANGGPFEYVQGRLLNGVSVSTAHVRLNYTLALIALIRAAKSTNVTAAAAVALYTDPSTFDISYASAMRERALGALAISSALVVSSASVLTPAAARNVIRLIRITLEPGAIPWCLSSAAISITSRLLENALQTTRDALAKPLWLICTQSPATQHALALALLFLLDLNLASPSAVQSLYPSLNGNFSDALLSVFDTGFSLFDSALIGKNDRDVSTKIVPLSWRLAVKYVCAPKNICPMNVDLKIFWSNIVKDFLMNSHRSCEKKIFVVQLLTIVAVHVHDMETFDVVFDHNLTSLIIDVAETGRPSKRLSNLTSEHISHSLRTMARDVLSELSSSSRPESERFSLTNAFWVWNMKGGLSQLLFPGDELVSVLSALNVDAGTSLLKCAVTQFAVPKLYESKGGNELDNARLNAARFLVSLARSRHDTASDVMKVLTLYSMFKSQQSEGSSLSKSLEFDMLKCDSDRNFGGCLPQLDPRLSAHVSSTVFRRLNTFLANVKDPVDANFFLSACFKAVSAGLSDKCGLVSIGGQDDLKAKFIDRIKCVNKSLVHQSSEGEGGAVSKALEDMSLFLGIELMDPSQAEENGNSEKAVSHVEEEYGPLLDRLEECRDSIQHTNLTKADEMDDKVDADPLEKLIHLISDLCGREGVWFKRIAFQILERLSSFIDDRVVSVLFDCVEVYRSGVERLGRVIVDDGEEIEEDDEREEVENIGESENVEEDEAEEETEKEEKDNNDVMDENMVPFEAENEELPVKSSNEDKEKDMKVSGDPSGKDANIASAGTSDDNSDSDSGVNVDVDEENPEVLAELDKRLSTHIDLLRKERQLNKRKKVKADSGLWRASRVLELVGQAARILRIRIEKSERNEGTTDERTGLVFVDVLVRLYEVIFNEEGNNWAFLNQITTIANKQICVVSVSTLSAVISDAQTMHDMVDRFFDVINQCKRSKELGSTENRAVSKAAGLLMSVSVSLSDEVDYSRFLPIYERLLRKILSKDGYMLSIEMLSSFVQRAGDTALKLMKVVDSVFDNNLAKRARWQATELILMWAMFIKAKQLDHTTLTKEGATAFWNDLDTFVEKNVTVQSVKTTWTRASLMNIIRAVSLGLQGDSEMPSFSDKKRLPSLMWPAVQQMRVENSDRSQIAKLLGMSEESQPKTTKLSKKRRKSKSSASRKH